MDDGSVLHPICIEFCTTQRRQFAALIQQMEVSEGEQRNIKEFYICKSIS